ncbi:hypothetical protein B0H19DRAFT_1099086 [Mycena capillaripes]|nr:hypothetical protein B0H19DRAFT_1099086 [Mycena capillaripes]
MSCGQRSRDTWLYFGLHVKFGPAPGLSLQSQVGEFVGRWHINKLLVFRNLQPLRRGALSFNNESARRKHRPVWLAVWVQLRGPLIYWDPMRMRASSTLSPRRLTSPRCMHFVIGHPRLRIFRLIAKSAGRYMTEGNWYLFWTSRAGLQRPKLGSKTNARRRQGIQSNIHWRASIQR